MTTELSPLATPGPERTFDPKTEAGSEKGPGPFTQLSVIGLPGRILQFVAKDPTTEVATPAGNAGIWVNQYMEEDDIMAVIIAFLTMRN